MRLIAIALTILAGAILFSVHVASGARGGHADDLGGFCIVVGLMALGVELYIVPVIKWKLGRD